MHDTKKYPMLIQKVVNMPPVEWDIPLFVFPIDLQKEGYTTIVDFNETHYRYVENRIAEKMCSSFDLVGDITLPILLSDYFFSILRNSSYYKAFNWWKESITERDMKENPELYHQWKQSEKWANLLESIEKLPNISEKVIEVLESK